MKYNITYVCYREGALKVYINNFYVAYVYPGFTLFESAYTKDIDRIEQEVKDELLVFLKNEKNNIIAKKYPTVGMDEPDPKLPVNKMKNKLPEERLTNEEKKRLKEIETQAKEAQRLMQKELEKEKNRVYRRNYNKSSLKERRANRTPEEIAKEKAYQKSYRERKKQQKASK